jgi:hypothetical protein
LQEQNEQCDYFCWIDPEWDERSYAVMLNLKKKVKAEEDAKQCKGNWEKLTVSLERLGMSSK